MRFVTHPSSYPMNMFKELYNKLLAIKNFVANPSGQPSLNFMLSACRTNFTTVAHIT